MKVEQILKSITPEVKKREIEKIKKVKLPKELQKWVDEYKRAGGERDYFFWKWIYKEIQETTLFMPEKKYQKSTWECEFLLIMFIVILDYIVDRKRNKKLLDELLKIPFIEKHTEFSKFNKSLLVDFAIKVWQQIEKNIRAYPRYKEFREIWNYDISQITNAMKYDYIVNNNHFLINKTEYWLYSPHTMQIVAATIINLMCLSKFNVCEFGLIRRVAWEIQKMARISNWISTWEREIKEDDFSSGVFAYALELNVITYDELKKENYLKIIKRIKEAKIENKILEDWDKCYFQASKYNKKIKSIDVGRFLFGAERVLVMYMITKGRI